MSNNQEPLKAEYSLVKLIATIQEETKKGSKFFLTLFEDNSLEYMNFGPFEEQELIEAFIKIINIIGMEKTDDIIEEFKIKETYTFLANNFLYTIEKYELHEINQDNINTINEKFNISSK